MTTKAKVKKEKVTEQAAVPSAPNAAWEAIYKTIARIPVGRVTTYGTVAQLAGLPRRARLVGTALKSLPSAHKIPWQRVIGAGGRLAFPENSDAYTKQRRLLAREGIKMSGTRIDMARYE
jgi:methylated-DNA-protein-cysteine methyltransferase related protein